MRSGSIGRAIAVLCVFALSACQGDEEKLAEHLKRAEAYVEENQFPEALIEYKNVLQIDPNHSEAHYGLARAYLGLNKAREGFWELRETVRLDPQNLEAKKQFGSMAFFGGDLDEALKQAEEVIAADPEDVPARLLKARTLEALRRPEEALAAYEEALEIAPEREEPMVLLAAYYRRSGDPEAAEALLQRLVEIVPTSASYARLANFLNRDPDRDAETEAALQRAVELAEDGEQRVRSFSRLASFLQGRQRPEQAVEVLQGAIEKEEGEEELQLIYFLARLQRILGNEAEAEALIERATQARPDEATPHLVLSQYRNLQGDLPGALEAARRAREIDPTHRAASLRVAELLVELGLRDGDHAKVAEGRETVELVLTEEPTHPVALAVVAKVAIAEGNLEEAITSLRASIDSRPDWGDAHYLLGVALARRGEREAARTELARALEIDSGLIEARRVLTDVHVALGEHAFAIEEGRRYLREKPDVYAVRVLVAQSLARTGQLDEALRELDAIPQEARTAKIAYAFGRLHMGMRHWDEARTFLMLANEELPNHADILRSLMGIDRIQNRFPESLERIDAAVRAEPENAGLLVLKGTAMQLAGRTDEAERSFKRAVEIDPGQVAAYERLAGLYGASGRVDDAIGAYEQAVEARPEEARLHHFLGILYEMNGQRDLAAERYEEAIRRNPNLGEAKNNLAYLFAEQERELDRALDLAQEAKALLPDNPHTADTLGWVLYRRGIPAAAIGYLQEGESGFEPGDPSLGMVRFHLAQAYEANGDRALARETLERALGDLSSRRAPQSGGEGEIAEPPWAADVRSMLSRLQDGPVATGEG